MQYDLLRKGNIVSVSTSNKNMNFLIMNVSRKNKELSGMPLIIDESYEEIPLSLSISFDDIKSISKPKILDLFYFLNKNNSLILNAIKKIIK